KLQPRRPRSTSPFISSSSTIFRPDIVFVLLRKAYKEPELGIVCRMASRILHKLIEPAAVHKATELKIESPVDATSKSEFSNPATLVDYSSLFGDSFHIPDDRWDSNILNLLDIGAVEEGIFHILFACASQPSMCHKLSESTFEFWSALPLIQALLPALRPTISNFGDNLDENFSPWKQPFVMRALSEIVSMSASALYRPLLHACAGYLSSFSPSHKQNSYFQQNRLYLKGYVAKNAKAIILYILEAIMKEHMEAMVPEVPKIVQVLVSLCRSSYYDVPFLESVMRLLKPIISYSLRKTSEQEMTCIDESCVNFELLCFEDLLVDLRQRDESEDISSRNKWSRASTIFVMASVFVDLSSECKRDILQSLTLWVGFASFEPSTSFHDYFCAFQAVLESCKTLLVQTLRFLGLLPVQLHRCPDVTAGSMSSNHPGRRTLFLNDVLCRSVEVSEVESNHLNDVDLKQENHHLCPAEIEGFCSDLENLILKLNPHIEPSWNLHHCLAEQLTVVSSECFVYLHCLTSIVPTFKSANDSSQHWEISLQKFAESIMELQENHCWEVASLMLDCLLGIPYCFPLDNIVSSICSVMVKFSRRAPKLAWRLQSDKWLSMLFERNVASHCKKDENLTDLFISLLGNPEPEQRFVALRHLGRLLGLDLSGEPIFEYPTLANSLGSVLVVSESFLSFLVSRTWDRVVLLASTDKLLPLQACSMALLLGYIPHADKEHLQSFLAGADSILRAIGNSTFPTCEGQLLQLSLALLATACLYSPAEDVSLIPQKVWRNVETVESTRTGT
ncbi:hypothetical protein LINPERPRIM_LOCUS1103, partial [Linum perenne]